MDCPTPRPTAAHRRPIAVGFVLGGTGRRLYVGRTAGTAAGRPTPDVRQLAGQPPDPKYPTPEDGPESRGPAASHRGCDRETPAGRCALADAIGGEMTLWFGTVSRVLAHACSWTLVNGEAFRLRAGRLLEPRNDPLRIQRVWFHQDRPATRLLSGDQRASAAEKIRYVLAHARRVWHRPEGPSDEFFSQMDLLVRNDVLDLPPVDGVGASGGHLHSRSRLGDPGHAVRVDRIPHRRSRCRSGSESGRFPDGNPS